MRLVLSQRSSRWRPGWLLVVVASCSLSSEACATSRTASTGKVSDRSSYRDTLRLELEIGKPAVVVGEPVYLTLRLHNIGSTAVNVASYLELEGETIQVTITPQNGKTVPFVPLAIDDVVDAGRELAPGEAATLVVPVFYGGRGWSFTEAGTYSLVARYQDFGRRSRPIESAPATLEVSEDPPSRFLTQGPASAETGKFLLWQSGDHLRRAHTQLKELLARYPSSILNDSVRLALGVSLSRSFKDYSIDRLRLPQFAKAMEYLEKVRTESLPTYLRVQKGLVEGRCLTALNRRDEGERAMATARRLAQERPEYRSLFEAESRLEPALPPYPRG